ncbi:hypothetical protein O6H91_02G089400 [Diphasiastrum complanatum]|uniref:Uncharacterized protein n=1 Tax=Diphasiastrum complanatum TaxID=34168 RepID=A0ACC2EI80_DIPCM|nr:hypothetical protein O6H91_02G089400 [Diphasiastrum complanatum]
MDLNGRRGLKRSFVDRGAPLLPHWVDSRPGALAYPQYGLTPELASHDIPHLTSSFYPSESSLYPDTPGKLVLVNPDPVMYSAPYLPSSALPPGVSAFPPSGSHIFGVNNPAYSHSNGFLPVDDYGQPLNPVVHPHQLAPIEVHEPLTRLGEYSLAPPFRDRYPELPPRSVLSQGSLSARRRAAPLKGRLARDRSPPRFSGPHKKQQDRSPARFSGPQKKKRATLPAATNKSKEVKKSKKGPAVLEKSKEVTKVIKQDVAADAKAKDAKGTKTENPIAENPIAGMIFGCNDLTEKECRRLQLFGLPAVRKNDVLRVIPGSKLFLFNFDSKELSGVFEAVSHGALDIVPNAFQSYGSFPAQVRTKRIMRVPNLPFKKFKKAIKENFYSDRKFNYELSASQVEKLVELFASTKDEGAK